MTYKPREFYLLDTVIEIIQYLVVVAYFCLIAYAVGSCIKNTRGGIMQSGPIIITPREADKRKHDMTRAEIQAQIREYLQSGRQIQYIPAGVGAEQIGGWNKTGVVGMTVPQVANKLGLSRTRVYEDVLRGHLEFYYLNGTKYIKPEDVPAYERFIKSGREVL